MLTFALWAVLAQADDQLRAELALGAREAGDPAIQQKLTADTGRDGGHCQKARHEP